MILLILIPVILALMVAASNSRNLHRPNGYSPRGGWLHPNKRTVGERIQYVHGQVVRVGSLEDFINNKGRIKYYNKYTDELQDTDPT